MFDAGSGGSNAGIFDSGDDQSPERRQYTLKGVEADTIKLMRYAASKEGMKIGSWVSLRMREAAERALSSSNKDSSSNTSTRYVDISSDLPTDLSIVLEKFQQFNDDRLTKIERELHEITSSQRTILAALISQKNNGV